MHEQNKQQQIFKMRGGDLIYTPSIVIKSTATTIYEVAIKHGPLGGLLQSTTGKRRFPIQRHPPNDRPGYG
jgi:hypothetical protein